MVGSEEAVKKTLDAPERPSRDEDTEEGQANLKEGRRMPVEDRLGPTGRHIKDYLKPKPTPQIVKREEQPSVQAREEEKLKAKLGGTKAQVNRRNSIK